MISYMEGSLLDYHFEVEHPISLKLRETRASAYLEFMTLYKHKHVK